MDYLAQHEGLQYTRSSYSWMEAFKDRMLAFNEYGQFSIDWL